MMTFPSIRQPEHTGENRCWPCTLVNLAIVTIVCLVVVAIDAPVLAAAIAAAGVVAVYVRGYVVPYTPQFAPRLVDVLPWNPFHDGPAEAGSLAGGFSDVEADGEQSDREGEAILATLVENDVIELDVEDDMVYLESDFEERWHDEMATLATMSDEELAGIVADMVPEAAAESVVVSRGRTYVVLSSESGAATDEVWIRRPVAVAEVAAVNCLASTGLPLEIRRNAAHSLCPFLETCPECGEELVEGTEGGCCGTPRYPNRPPRDTLVCRSCRTQFAILE